MARTVTLADLVTELEERADIQNDQSIAAAEKVRLINKGITDLYDELVAAAPPDYYLKDFAITTTGDEAGYVLPDDFFKIRRVQVKLSGSTERRSLTPMQPDERVVLTPSTGASIVLEYIPVAPTLVLDADTFDGVNGWDELIVLWAAVKVFQKKRLPIGDLAGQYQQMMARIRANAYQDPGSPPMIQRASLRRGFFPWSGAAQVAGYYRLRGLGAERKLEIYTRNYLGAGAWP